VAGNKVTVSLQSTWYAAQNGIPFPIMLKSGERETRFFARLDYHDVILSVLGIEFDTRMCFSENPPISSAMAPGAPMMCSRLQRVINVPTLARIKHAGERRRLAKFLHAPAVLLDQLQNFVE